MSHERPVISIRRERLCFVALLAVTAGCSPAKNAGAGPTTAPAPAPAPATHSASNGVATYENKQAKFRLSYPADWKPAPSKDYVLALVPKDDALAAKADRMVSVDVPSLPPHLPGMITLGAIQNGLLDDLRKQWTEVKVLEGSTETMPDAKARRV